MANNKRKYEATYDGTRLGGKVEQLVKEIEFLFRESAILDAVEQCLTEFIQVNATKLVPDFGKGDMWLSRHNASHKGQDAFYVEFSTGHDDRKEGFTYITCVIAEGRFLGKKLFIRPCKNVPSYVIKHYIPFLKEFFTKFGFKIVNNEKKLDK